MSSPLLRAARHVAPQILRSRSLQPTRHIIFEAGLWTAKRHASTIVKTPQMAESISEGTLKQWSKEVGDFVEQDEEIATIETDKIDVAVNAPESGIIKEFLVQEEDTVTVGQDLVRLETGGNAPEKPTSQSKSESSASEGKEEGEESHAAPPNSSSSSSNVPKSEQNKPADKPTQSASRAQESPVQKPRESSQQQEATSSQRQSSGSRDERRVKMNRMRLRIGERLKQSQNTAASLTTFNEVDMSSVIEFRKLYKDEILKRTGVKLGFMSAFARACVLAMRDIPTINASIEGPDGGDTIVYRDFVDISIAVATEKGLVTPIVRNVESMDLVAIERSIADLGKKARDNKLTIEDMAGGTFTISNGGVFGSMMSTPIINLPQTAVLGLHAIKDRAVVVNGKIEVRPMMNLALTYDHRLLDGREAATFLVKIKEFIEDPRRMLL